MKTRLLTTSELLAGKTKLTSLDYRAVLSKCRETDLVYMDPPYQGVCGNRDCRYQPTITHEQFCAELQTLNDRNIRYIISYDGRTGNKAYGEPMPDSLNLHHLELPAGRSTQATLLGRDCETFESLYLSPNLEPAIPELANSQLSLW